MKDNSKITRRSFLKYTGLALGGLSTLSSLNRWFLPGAEAFIQDEVSDHFIRMIFHENSLGPSPLAVEAVKEILNKTPHSRGIHTYPDFLYEELKNEILRYNKVENILTTDNVILGVGSTGILIMIADRYLSPKNALITEWPTYRIFLERAEQNKAKVIKILLNSKNEPDFDLILKTLSTEKEAKIIHFNVINNPVGSFIKRDLFDKFAYKVFQDYPNVIIVADDSDREFMEEDKKRFFPNMLDYVIEGKNLIHVQTFSHIFGLTGLRIGYAIAPVKLINEIKEKEIFGGVSIASAAAAHASLLDASSQIKRAFNYNDEGRKFLYENFNKMGLYFYPSQGAYVLVDVKRDSSVVFLLMLKEKILIRDAKEWDFNTFIRVNPGLPDENEQFIKALKKVLLKKISYLSLKDFLNTPEGMSALNLAQNIGFSFVKG